MSIKFIEVAEWKFGDIPYKLDEFFAKLNEVRLSIPAEYRDSAEIDCDPEWERGESYARVRISYSRPMTEEEVAEQAAEDREHWAGQLQDAVERQAYCQKQIAELSA